MKTKTAAIKHARRKVNLFQIGGQWQVATWSEQHRAWRHGPVRDYWSARASQSQSLIDYAREFLGKNPVQYDGGSWTLYV